MPLQLLKRLQQQAATRADKPAIREIGAEGRSATFAQLAAMVASFAESVASVVSPCGVVLICLPNRIECTAAFLGTLEAGRTGFLVNPNVSDYELLRAVETARAEAVAVARGVAREIDGWSLRRLVVPDVPDQLAGSLLLQNVGRSESDSGALMLLSSGTTGDPKIVVRDGPSIDAVASNTTEAIRLTPDDRVLGLVPLCHSYGVEHGILAPTYAGCCVHLCQGFDTRTVLDQLARGGITVFPGVPSAFEMLATLGDGTGVFPDLRCAYSAGSTLPMSVVDACRKNWGVRVGQLYGSSEVGSITFNDPNQPDHDPMSVGLPMSGVVAVTVDPTTRDVTSPLPPGVEGELAIHAPSMLSGYVGQTESPLVDGYFFTGDLARLDVRGAITITGRIKLLIDVGALKVNPLEVEEVLAQCPGVGECVVVPVPISDTVSRIRAVIVPEDVADPPSAETLRRFARARLSAHKVPRVVDIVDALPKSPTGKVLRRQIAS